MNLVDFLGTSPPTVWESLLFQLDKEINVLGGRFPHWISPNFLILCLFKRPSAIDHFTKPSSWDFPLFVLDHLVQSSMALCWTSGDFIRRPARHHMVQVFVLSSPRVKLEPLCGSTRLFFVLLPPRSVNGKSCTISSCTACPWISFLHYSNEQSNKEKKPFRKGARRQFELRAE